MLPRRTPNSIWADNLKNRIAGTAELIDRAAISIQDVRASILARIELREELLSAICGDPDRRNFARKERKVFRQDIAELKARIVGFEKSVVGWREDIRRLQLRLRWDERMSL